MAEPIPHDKASLSDPEKEGDLPSEHQEDATKTLAWSNEDVEPEFHHRTWLAVVALLFLNYVQVFCLLGPPQIVR